MKRVFSVTDPSVAGEGYTLDEAVLNYASAVGAKSADKFITKTHVTLEDYLATNTASKAIRKMQTTGAYGKIGVDHG